MKRKSIISGLIVIAILFAMNLILGKIQIPINEIFNILTGNGSDKTAWQHIVLQSRLPQAITALLAGASLATSGLLLQTLFRNPLAGPSILGISDGANLGVALVMLLLGNSISFSSYTFSGSLAMIMASFTGACVILFLIIFFSGKVSSPVMLLIIGIMIGYLASSAISILNYYSSADRVRAYVMWGMGDFSAVTNERLPFFVICSIAGLFLSVLLIKPLNALLLGEMYAANLGINIKRTRLLILLCTGLLTATATAFCGPVSFIGLAVPHIARLILGTSNHSGLLPLTIIAGACTALVCNIITILPGSDGVLPLNAVTPLIGAPIIIYVIVNRKNIQYFN
ncbi:MAG: iron ABC transporter permease [Bacteroidales bacterium]|jgi:iron complex transport system permease protein|nr:iron ABC transporter permease [Bacteroidales bacterium]